MKRAFHSLDATPGAAEMTTLQQKIEWLRLFSKRLAGMGISRDTDGQFRVICTPGEYSSLNEITDDLEIAFDLLETVYELLPDPDFMPIEDAEILTRSIRNKIAKFLTIK